MPSQTRDTRTPAAGRCVVVFGTESGVGKTMVAANLAVSIAQRTGTPVCLIDLDVASVGQVARAFQVSARRSIADLMPELKRTAQLETLALDGVVISHSSGVHLIAGLSTPRQLNQLDGPTLRRLLEALTKRYAYVLVDGGKAFSDVLIAAFDAASLLLLVTSPDLITLYQTKWALGMMEGLSFPCRMVKVILNRTNDGLQDVRGAVPCEVIGAIPLDESSVSASLTRGTPLVTAFSQTEPAAAISRLAASLVSRSDWYLPHEAISRHRRAVGSAAQPISETTMWSSRLYAEDKGVSPEESADPMVRLKRRIYERIVKELDLKKLQLAAVLNSAQLLELRQKTERVIAALLAQEAGTLIASQEVRARLVKEIADEALGLGPLEELLADPEVSDILVNSKDQIYVERHGRLELTPKRFLSDEQVVGAIERITSPLGRRVDESSPMVDARLPDGSRINAIIPPLSLKGPMLSIRKFSRIRYSQEDLIHFGSLTPAMMQFLHACVLARKNILISGGAGSGKTTLLNVLSMFIPTGDRIITIEDAAELKLAQAHWVSLEARPSNIEGKGQITMRDLFRNALRMRPDRIIIGECRGAETLDMLQAMNTGHEGSLTTVHANSPRDVITRLDSLVLMSNIELPIRAIREMVASAIQIILHIARLSDGSRKVTSISEVMGVVDGVDCSLHTLFLYKQTGVEADGTVRGHFVATGQLPSFFEELKLKGIVLDQSLFVAPDDSECARIASPVD